VDNATRHHPQVVDKQMELSTCPICLKCPICPGPKGPCFDLIVTIVTITPFCPFFQVGARFFFADWARVFVKCACVTLRKMIAFGYDTYTVGKICCCFWILACPWFCRMGRDLGGGVIGPWARVFVRHACITL
jgi:hypothetical protein